MQLFLNHENCNLSFIFLSSLTTEDAEEHRLFHTAENSFRLKFNY